MNRCTPAVLLLLTLVTSVPAEAEHSQRQEKLPLAQMADAEFTAFLGELERDLARWRETLQPMSMGALPLHLQDREAAERQHRLCEQAIEEIEQKIHPLAQKQTFYDDIQLLLALHSLRIHIDLLHSAVAQPTASQDSIMVAQAHTWAQKIWGVTQGVGHHTERFQEHVLAFAFAVDLALERAKEKSKEREVPR